MKKCIAVLMLLALLAAVAVPAFADGNVTYDGAAGKFIFIHTGTRQKIPLSLRLSLYHTFRQLLLEYRRLISCRIPGKRLIGIRSPATAAAQQCTPHRTQNYYQFFQNRSSLL